MGIFVFGIYPVINSVQRVQAKKAILFRNAAAANLCKCEKWTHPTEQARCWMQVSQMAK